VVGPSREVRPIVELFKCSWLNLGANLAERCGVKTTGLRVSMRFMGPEKVGLLQSQGLLGPAL
jgi:hypothetical protein